MGFKIPKIIKQIAPIYGAAAGGLTAFGAAGAMAGKNIGNMLAGNKSGGGGSGPGGAPPAFGMRKTEEFIKDDPAEQLGQPGAIGRRFSGMRERTGQEFNAAADTQTDALKRKFASMGASGSGAMIKLQQQNDQALTEKKAGAMQQINEAEEDANMQHDAAQAQMNFQQKVFNFERGSKMHELDLAERQQQVDSTTTEFNKRVAEFQMKPPKKGLFSGIIDGIL